MRSKGELHSEAAEKTVRDIRRATRRQYSVEEKVRIVIAGLRGENSIAELCRKESARPRPLEGADHLIESGPRSLLVVAADVFAAELFGTAIEMLGEAGGARTASNHRAAV